MCIWAHISHDFLFCNIEISDKKELRISSDIGLVHFIVILNKCTFTFYTFTGNNPTIFNPSRRRTKHGNAATANKKMLKNNQHYYYCNNNITWQTCVHGKCLRGRRTRETNECAAAVRPNTKRRANTQLSGTLVVDSVLRRLSRLTSWPW